MADYLNIAGRIRTTASDGVAMEAQEVKDLNLNKSQQEINSDVQNDLGDRYTKEETYNRDQLNELITTPDVNRVYVIATNLTTAVTDLLPATGSSDTLYNVGNWDGTQYDTTVYSIYGWDGTAYVCLAVRSFIGEVYDISANHPDGQGNPTPYADLTAALGTSGANVPVGIRRGGMSIKFIQGNAQSSDNKYVQYMYLGTAVTGTPNPFLNIDNWQMYDVINTENRTGTNLDISDEEGYILARFSNGNIKTKNFDSSKDATESDRGLMSSNDKTKLNTIEQGAEVNAVEIENLESFTDLNVTDDDNNILVLFQDGNIKTKNFDSSNTPAGESGSINSDLDLSDDQGNILVRFQNGGIKTKEFDSRHIKKYANRPEDGYENFLVQVNAGIENNYATTTNLQDSINLQNDRGIICFPNNYNPTGEPVRLMIVSPGSDGRITSSSTTIPSIAPLMNVILGEGYAIMTVNGTPGYTDGIESYGGMATPGFLNSIQVAYKYVIEKYNIKKDGVLLSGFSQGSAEAWQIAANKVIPVKAMTMFGPCVDLWKGMYAYTPQANREWMCEQFGFVEKEANDYVLNIFGDIYSQGDIVTKPTTYSNRQTVPNDYEFAYILNNYETWLGYDPICWGTSKDIIGEQFRYRNWVNVQDPNEDLCFQDVANIVPCPMKMFVGTADVLTPPKIVNWYKRMADNAAMMCHVRTYQGGTHSYTSTSAYPTIQVQTKYGGTITTNVPSWEGMLFLERYD